MTKEAADTILDPEEKILLSKSGKTTPAERINVPFLEELQEEVRKKFENYKFDGFDWKIGKINPTNQDIWLDGEVTEPGHKDHQ